MRRGLAVELEKALDPVGEVGRRDAHAGDELPHPLELEAREVEAIQRGEDGEEVEGRLDDDLLPPEQGVPHGDLPLDVPEREEAPVALDHRAPQRVGIVGHAFAQYVYATGDDDFANEKAWPVVEGVADWIVSRLFETQRGYEFRQTLGFAEGRDAAVDNDAYVNMAAIVVLQEAAELADRYRHPDGARWRAVAGRIPLKIENGIIFNHDRFSPAEGGVVGATPEALGGLFPFGYEVPPEVESKTIRFYLDRVDPYVGYPMFSAPLGVFAARIGDRELAARLFEEGYAEYSNQPWLDANEFSVKRHPDRPVVGPMFANLGGFLTSCLFGLTGLKLGIGEPDSWPQRPVAMPACGDGVEVDRLWVRGRPGRLSARHGEPKARLELDEVVGPLPAGPHPASG